MLGYRKRSFAHAHAMVNTLRAARDNLGTLESLQQLLCREIIRAERKIREIKSELKNVVQTGGSTAPKRSSYLRNRIKGLRQCMYVWRCFGDAIAFTYMDKFALKQCYYNIENSNVRQDAGFIADKRGLPLEIHFVEVALKEQIPALLVDLTNTIRYGDVCLMSAPDPQLIEIKASKNLDSRGKKQKRNLKKVHDFFETDRAVGLRGFAGEVQREAPESPERTYVAEINACITEALINGCAAKSPERGLSYLVMTTKGPNIEDAMRSLNLKEPWVFDLNEAKMHRAWAPYLPFVLTIEDKDHLWQFIGGELYILVFVEVGTLCQIAVDNGYQAKFDGENADHPLRISVPGTNDYLDVSSPMLARIAFEFVSPEWIVLASIGHLRHAADAGRG